MAARGLLTIMPSRTLLSSKFNTTIATSNSALRLSSSMQFYHHIHTPGIHCVLSSAKYQTVWNSQRGVQEANCVLLARPAPQTVSWCIVRSYAKKAKKEKVQKGGKKKVVLNAEELEGVLDLEKLQHEMQAVAEDLKQQMIQQISLRTNIGVYDNLQVKTDDGVFPLIQLSQVVQKNPSLILVNMAASPQYLAAVKDAISQSGLNVNPQQDGTTIFIPLPKVTREHREGLAKNAKMLHDKAKTRLRDIHNKYVKKVRGAKDHHSEDVIKGAQDMVLDEMHNYGQQLDTLLAAKQQELLGGK